MHGTDCCACVGITHGATLCHRLENLHSRCDTLANDASETTTVPALPSHVFFSTFISSSFEFLTSISSGVSGQKSLSDYAKRIGMALVEIKLNRWNELLSSMMYFQFCPLGLMLWFSSSCSSSCANGPNHILTSLTLFVNSLRSLSAQLHTLALRRSRMLRHVNLALTEQFVTSQRSGIANILALFQMSVPTPRIFGRAPRLP